MMLVKLPLSENLFLSHQYGAYAHSEGTELQEWCLYMVVFFLSSCQAEWRLCWEMLSRLSLQTVLLHVATLAYGLKMMLTDSLTHYISVHFFLFFPWKCFLGLLWLQYKWQGQSRDIGHEFFYFESVCLSDNCLKMFALLGRLTYKCLG